MSTADASPTSGAAPQLAFSRWDRWGTQAIIILLMLAAVFVGLVLPIIDWINGEPTYFAMDASATSVDVPALDAAKVSYWTDASTIEVEIVNPTAHQRLLQLAPGALASVALAAGAWIVLRVLNAIGHQRAFHASTVRDLRLLGLASIIAAGVWPFIVGSSQFGLADSMGIDGVEPVPGMTISLAPIVVGLLIGAVAEAFNQARKLQDDVEGLI